MSEEIAKLLQELNRAVRDKPVRYEMREEGYGEFVLWRVRSNGSRKSVCTGSVDAVVAFVEGVMFAIGGGL